MQWPWKHFQGNMVQKIRPNTAFNQTGNNLCRFLRCWLPRLVKAIVERRANAPLNGELLRQRLVGGARKMRAAQQSAGASRRLAVWLRQPATGACSAQLAVGNKK